MENEIVKQLQKSNLQLQTEIRNLTSAQGSLFRFQEKVERLKTIYAQIAESAQTFNQQLQFEVLSESTHRFLVDHLNFESSVLLLEDETQPSQLHVHSQAGFGNKSQIKTLNSIRIEKTALSNQFGTRNRLDVSSAPPDLRKKIKEHFDLDHWCAITIGTFSASGPLGILIAGTSQQHLGFHAKPEEDSDLDAVLSNITNQIYSAKKTLGFLNTIQAETNQVKQLLHNMKQSVFLVNQELLVQEPVSLFSEQLFGESIVGSNVMDLLFSDQSLSDEAKTGIRTCFANCFGESAIQWDLENHLLPPRIEIGGQEKRKVLKSTYSPIFDNEDSLHGILFVIEDITDLEVLQKKVAAEQSRTQVIQQIANNEIGSLNADFFLPTRRLLEACREIARTNTPTGLGESLRNLHTIKGNARLFGFSGVSSCVHNIETEIQQKRNVDSKMIETVYCEVARYAQIAEEVFKIRNLFTIQSHDSSSQEDLQLSQVEVSWKLVKSLLAETEKPELSKFKELRRIVRDLSSLDGEDFFGKYNAMVTEISRNLGKSTELVVEAKGVRIERDMSPSIQDMLTHILRNCLDHGIEPQNQRIQAGKSPKGQIKITAVSSPETL